MKKCWVVFLLICLSIEGYSQSPIKQVATAVSIPTTQVYSVGETMSNADEASHYLSTHHRLLNQADYSIKIISTKKSLTGYHYTFAVSKDLLPIYAAQVRIHTDLSGNVRMIQDNVPDIPAFFVGNIDPQLQQKWVLSEGIWQVATFDDVGDDFGTISIVSDDVVLDRITTKHFFQVPDTQVKAQVFLVNPLNTAERGYGSPYIDSSDLDVPALNAERKWVDMRVEFKNDTFWLKSDRYYIGHVSNPVTPPTFSLTDTFSFTRSQYQFEDVNAYYHVNNMSNHVEQLGFESALPDTLVIDAHAYSGGDFSSFNYGVSPVELEFGEGGVDDAEDGEIVVHEFAHALAHFAGGDSYANTRDRSAMEEGNADYFCTSYSKYYNSYAVDTIFNWDWGSNLGSLPYILIGGNKQYPQDMTGNSNADRSMWSTPLMCIYDKIGRNACDSLVLEHLYYQYKTATIPEMANILLTVDSLLFQKKYHQEIRQCFSEHNILLGIESHVAFNQLFTAFNTYGFSQGVESAQINAKSGQNFSYTVFDNVGQVITSDVNVNRVNLHPQSFKSGIYFVELKMGGFTSFLKLMKY